MIVSLLGGIGLFLLGMTLLTDGLKAVAGEALKNILSKFVKGPVSAISSGTLVTVLVQSSSATTLATIGFVSAGLLTFPQTLGVLLGAKLGTTSTGWIVAALGLRFSITAFALPFIGVGALARLLTKGRMAHAGMALAGFGLIFVGIDVLQGGMEQFRDIIDMSALPAGTLSGKLLLILTGIVMTIIMQSSSAAVATTLTALFAGAIDIHQAAALVVGQNFGTAFTALLAIIGASVAAVRTGVAFILFSGIIAIVAFALLPVYGWAATQLDVIHDPSQAAISIAAFHTVFNLIGIMVILPFRTPLSRLVARWIPEQKDQLTPFLDSTVTNIPSIAVEAVNRTLKDIHFRLLNFTNEILDKPGAAHTRTELQNAELSLTKVTEFMSGISVDANQKSDYYRYLATLHALDHLHRYTDACRDSTKIISIAGKQIHEEMVGLLQESLTLTLKWITKPDRPEPSKKLKKISRKLASLRKVKRIETLKQTAQSGKNSAETLQFLEMLRWLDRLAYHNWRAVYHLAEQDEYETDPPYPG